MSRKWHLEHGGEEIDRKGLDLLAEKLHHLKVDPRTTCVLCRQLVLRDDGKVILFDNYGVSYVFEETGTMKVVFDD